MARLTTVLALLATAAGVMAAPHRNHGGPSAAVEVPVINAGAENTIPGSYIVVYNNNMTDDVLDRYQDDLMAKIAKRNVEKRALHEAELAKRGDEGVAPFTSTGMNAIRVNTFRAMALSAADESMLMDIYNAAEVAYIEQDARVHALAVKSQTGATTGLSRLSHARIETARSKTYRFDDSAGAGITAYVVDTGIQTNHAEFGGRAVFGANFVNNVNTDENGHGTHVAGTIGGTTFGVAKRARLVGVKVLDANGDGTNSGVIAGMNWVAQNATPGKSVLNMSLGGERSRAVNAAINSLAAAGVVPIVAAGNENQDALNTSPASATSAIAIGAIDQTTDAKASFSNFGAAVALFAPGVDVESSTISSSSTTATEVLSGTSMAAPHVAGLAAYLMALEGITSTDQLLARMLALADATGATVKRNTAGTTSRIANNGQL